MLLMITSDLRILQHWTRAALGRSVPELSELGLLGLGHDPVGHGVGGGLAIGALFFGLLWYDRVA